MEANDERIVADLQARLEEERAELEEIKRVKLQFALEAQAAFTAKCAELQHLRNENDEFEATFAKRESHWIRENARLQIENAALKRPVSDEEIAKKAAVLLMNYFKKHSFGVKEIIWSNWSRGVYSGRQEAINVLNEIASRTQEAQKGE